MSQSSSQPETPTPGKLTFSTKLAFGAGDLGSAITANLLVFLLLPFFTDVAGLSAGLAGSILMVGKISDAINDPIIGVMSDRTESRWGRRYPWMLFGAIPFGILFFLQWIVPPFNVVGLFWYYLAIAVLFNLAYTAVNLPYTALTPELTRDYNERTSLNSFRFAFSIGGSILSLIVALGISSLIPDPKMQYVAIGSICAVASVLPIFWCFLGTKGRAAQVARQQPDTSSAATPGLAEQIRVALSNRPFLFVIGIYLCSWLAVQVTATILKYYVVSWMGLPDQIFFIVALAVQGTAMAMLFVWSAVSHRFGKKATYFAGMSVWIIAQVGLLFLQPRQVALMFVLAVMAGVGVSTAYLIPWSMLPDVIELDELQTGQRREGVFYAFMVLLQKLGLAIGLFLVGQSLDWAGYIERVAGQPIPVQPDSALLVIRLAIAPFPTLCLIAGAILAYFYPITKEVHEEILLKLQAKQEGK